MTALEDFINTIEATGGIRAFEDGTYGPEADEDWIDLGDSYVKACAELRRPILYADHHEFTREIWDLFQGPVPSAPVPESDCNAAYSAWVNQQLHQQINQPSCESPN
jgi:hypothetical protein